MEIARSAAGTEVTRCPYCHSSVAETEEQVACKQCLARHHRSCWDEGHRCASCSATTPLVAAGGDVIAPVEPVTADDDAVRREAARLLEENEQSQEGSAEALLSFPTLGILPIVQCENALAAHRDRNKTVESGPLPPLADDVKKLVEDARARAFSSKVDEHRHALTILGYFGVGLAAFVATQFHGAAGAGAVLYVGALVVLGGWMHAFREGVRRHEFDQFDARLVAGAVAPARIKEITEARQQAWSAMRFNDIANTFCGLVISPLVLLPLLSIRARRALSLHVKHDETLAGIQTARKETS
jgi:hypothetical protein